MVTYSALAGFLEGLVGAERYLLQENTRYRPSSRPVARMGLALEPWPGLGKWVDDNALDALFLHRPWRADLSSLPPDIGILASHLPFDDHLTLGYNPHLADLLEISPYAPFAEREGRILGMVGPCPPMDFTSLCARLNTAFGGLEQTWEGTRSPITSIAAVGAMTDALVREASRRGVLAYLTGQFRQPARDAVRETGMHVVAVGHRRSELWGLKTMAQLLLTQWPDLTIAVQE